MVSMSGGSCSHSPPLLTEMGWAQIVWCWLIGQHALESRLSQPTMLGLLVYTVNLASWMLAIWIPGCTHGKHFIFWAVFLACCLLPVRSVLFENGFSVSQFITQAVFQLAELCLLLQECSTTSSLKDFLISFWYPHLPLFILYGTFFLLFVCFLNLLFAF